MALSHGFRHVDGRPEEMSIRAQRYLRAAGLRHLVVGAFFFARPEFFQAAVYRQLERLLPFNSLLLWGVTSMVVGLSCLWGSFNRTEWWASRGLLGSFILSLVMCGAFVQAWITYDLPAPVVTTLLAAVARKDFIALGDPMRSPFDSVVEAFSHHRDK